MKHQRIVGRSPNPAQFKENDDYFLNNLSSPGTKHYLRAKNRL